MHECYSLALPLTMLWARQTTQTSRFSGRFLQLHCHKWCQGRIHRLICCNPRGCTFCSKKLRSIADIMQRIYSLCTLYFNTHLWNLLSDPVCGFHPISMDTFINTYYLLLLLNHMLVLMSYVLAFLYCSIQNVDRTVLCKRI